MRKIFPILLAIFINAGMLAQAPPKMSYQAVIRNSNNELVTSHTVGIKISILQGSATGTVIYNETQTQSTNANGLLSIEIGGGSGFNAINWANGPYFVKTETDPTGGMNYTISGTSQLLSVPYALYATTAGNGFSGSYNDLTNKPVNFDGTWTSLTGKPTTIAGYGITDAVNISGVQTITGTKTFSGTVSVNKPVTNNNVTNKAYVDSLIIQVMNSFAKTGETFTSPTTGTLKDADGNTIHIIKIGSQWWTAENLKVTHYRDGSYIANVTDNTTWNSLSSGARCYYGNDSVTYAATYGAYYNWYTIVDSRNLCPVGWHVPSDVEWGTLATYLGGNTVAGGKLKETGTTHWTSPNIATNESGFTALGGGYRIGSYSGLGAYGDFWTSTTLSTSNAWYIGMIFNSAIYSTNNYSKTLGIPIRCIRD
jgi:uncharacterized protein (TIGR02145 family)